MKVRIPFFVLALNLTLHSCFIINQQLDVCDILTVNITNITIGSSNDVVFRDDGSDLCYINRGLERGLNLDTLNAKVLNKTVTLHLQR